MTGILRTIRILNGFNGHAVAEPFAGGAGAALTLLYSRETHKVYINDLDPTIHAFWFSALHHSEALLDLLDRTPISVEEWKRWRDVYRSDRASPLELGFATFYLNRCNRSGIIQNGGVIGGIEQKGRWKIDARFNKLALRQRLERIAEECDRISVSNLDGIDFIDTLDPESTLYFVDPPYFKKGPLLYLNSLSDDYHFRLAEKLQSIEEAAWILTYDDCSEIRELYGEWAAIHPFSLRYSARERQQGSEVLITPRWMHLPEAVSEAAVTW